MMQSAFGIGILSNQKKKRRKDEKYYVNMQFAKCPGFGCFQINSSLIQTPFGADKQSIVIRMECVKVWYGMVWMMYIFHTPFTTFHTFFDFFCFVTIFFFYFRKREFYLCQNECCIKNYWITCAFLLLLWTNKYLTSSLIINVISWMAIYHNY